MTPSPRFAPGLSRSGYFIAQADAQRPYDTHLYRVDLEGKNLKQLTQAPGQHTPFRLRRRRKGIEFSPSKEFFLDTHSSVHRPPTVELRWADVAATVRSVYIVCTEEKFKKGGDSLVWPSG